MDPDRHFTTRQKWAMQLLGLGFANAGLAREQMRRLLVTIPYLYAMVLMNSYMLAIQMSLFIDPLTAFAIPLLLTPFLLLRAMSIGKAKRTLSDWSNARIRRTLAGISLVTLLYSVILGLWIGWMLGLAPYDEAIHIAVFAILTSMLAAYCLSSLPVASVAVLGAGAIYVTIAFSMQHKPGSLAIVLNILLIIAVTTRLIYQQFAFLRQASVRNDEIEKAHRQALQLAMSDQLTGLPNRRAFLDYLRELNHNPDGRTFAICLVDLDRFKPINDLYGHATGDRALVAIGERLRLQCDEEEMAARLGGDEFALILRIRPEDKIDSRLIRIHEAITTPYSIGNNQLTLGASIGVMVARTIDADPIKMVQEADIALYENKERSGDPFTFFSDAYRVKAARRDLVERAVSRDDKPEGLSNLYLPIFRSHGRMLAAFEAKARWDHPQLGLLPAAEFLRYTEHCGRMETLLSHIVTEALDALENWPAHVGLTINWPTSVLYPEAIDCLLGKQIKERGLAAQRISIEVDEREIGANLKSVERGLNRVREQGMFLTLDNFGIEHGSIRLLQRQQFDTVKLHPALLDNLATHASNRNLMAGLVQLCRATGLEISARGVTNEKQIDILSSLEVEFLEGPLIGEAVDCDGTATYFAAEAQRIA